MLIDRGGYFFLHIFTHENNPAVMRGFLLLHLFYRCKNPYYSGDMVYISIRWGKCIIPKKLISNLLM